MSAETTPAWAYKGRMYHEVPIANNRDDSGRIVRTPQDYDLAALCGFRNNGRSWQAHHHAWTFFPDRARPTDDQLAANQRERKSWCRKCRELAALAETATPAEVEGA